MENKILGYVVLEGTLTPHENDCCLEYIEWEFYRFLKSKEEAIGEAEQQLHVKVYEVTQDGYGEVIYENDKM